MTASDEAKHSALEVMSKEEAGKAKKRKTRSKVTRPRFANDPQEIFSVYISKCKWLSNPKTL